MKIAENISDLIGGTPMLRLNRLFPDSKSEIFAKLELLNPFSVKDRPAHAMVKAALAANPDKPDIELVEASSGNMAIALASLGARLGLRIRIFLSESCPAETKTILAAFGATIVCTPAEDFVRGARAAALAYCEKNSASAVFMNQHGNPANPSAHAAQTGPELWDQMNGEIDLLIAPMGTCGILDGVARYLHGRNPDLRVIGVEPAASPVYQGGDQGPHQIMGIGPGFVADNFKNSSVQIEEIMGIEDEIAFDWTRRIARVEGLLVGPSSGAQVAAIDQILNREIMAQKKIACFFCDTGERYLSMPGLFDDE